MENILSGKWLIDTQILVYALDAISPFHQSAKYLFGLVEEEVFQPVIAQQNILELEHVLINIYKQNRPEVIKTVESMIAATQINIIAPYPFTYLRYHSLLTSSPKTNPDIFDYFLAATMLDNRVTSIITANERDFRAIEGLKIYNPLP